MLSQPATARWPRKWRGIIRISISPTLPTLILRLAANPGVHDGSDMLTNRARPHEQYLNSSGEALGIELINAFGTESA
jgi:hypothetical protein